MKKYIFIAFLCNITYSAFSQMVIPGYQGKRFWIEANANAMLTTGTGLTYDQTGSTLFDFNPERKLGISTRYDFSVNYAVGRQYSLCLEYGTGATGFAAEGRNEFGDNSIAIFSKVNFSHIGFGYNHFLKSKGGLAPIGSYGSLKILYVTANAEPYEYIDRGEFIKVTPANRATMSIDSSSLSANFFNFQVGLGNRRILTNHLTLNFASHIGISSQGFKDALFFGRYDLFTRMSNHYSWHIQLGLGYLLF